MKSTSLTWAIYASICTILFSTSSLIAQNGHLSIEHEGKFEPGVSIKILDSTMYNDNATGLYIDVIRPHIGTGLFIESSHLGWSTYVGDFDYSEGQPLSFEGNRTFVDASFNDSIYTVGSDVYVSSSNTSQNFTIGIRSQIGLNNFVEQSDTIEWSEIANPAGYFTSNAGQGIVGESTGGYNSQYAGEEEELLKASQGVVGISQQGTGVNIGVLGYAANGYASDGVVGMVNGDINTHTKGAGIVGVNFMGDTLNFYAGEFFGRVSIDGDLDVIGNISKQGGSFKIDHPLDPANKYLSHSFVESPDMMNVYNGNISTDSQGLAVVELPNYFQALNKEFRYQLTPIGSFSQVIILEELEDNKFVIQSDKPNIKVSWQITGIRNDVWAKDHRIPTEEFKEDHEKGKFLYPAGFQSKQSIKSSRISSLQKYKRPSSNSPSISVRTNELRPRKLKKD